MPHTQESQKRMYVAETRYIADTAVDITLTAHESLEIECPRSRERLCGPFPANVNAPVQYGENLNALVPFNTVGAVSTKSVWMLRGMKSC